MNPLNNGVSRTLESRRRLGQQTATFALRTEVVAALRSFCQREDRIQQRVVERAIVNYLADNDPNFVAGELL